jgi:hypothetical protein
LIHEEIGWIEYQGEQVYRTPAHNTLASRKLFDQLSPYLPKDNEEVNVHVKRLQSMLDAVIMVDSIHDRDDSNWSKVPDHRQSPRRDSARSLTPPKEHGRRRDRVDPDLCNIVCDRDECGQIKNQRQERERIEQEHRDERGYDYYGHFYDQPHRQRS